MPNNPSTIQFGDKVLEVTDPQHIQPIMPDVITEARDFNGVVCISLGTIFLDGGGDPRVETCARLRMSLASAGDLKNSLENILKKSMPGKDKAN